MQIFGQRIKRFAEIGTKMMNELLKAITALCNLQRDKQLKPEQYTKKKDRKGEGFGEILKGEKERLKGGEDDNHKGG